jgi:hypothetical protein
MRRTTSSPFLDGIRTRLRASYLFCNSSNFIRARSGESLGFAQLLATMFGLLVKVTPRTSLPDSSHTSTVDNYGYTQP